MHLLNCAYFKENYCTYFKEFQCRDHVYENRIFAHYMRFCGFRLISNTDFLLDNTDKINNITSHLVAQCYLSTKYFKYATEINILPSEAIRHPTATETAQHTAYGKY